MASRTSLQKFLEELIGSRNVYFQPPSSVQMAYPAIVYSIENMNNTFADDKPYLQNKSYKVIVIDKNPDSEIVSSISRLKMCKFVSRYTSDNLNHTIFTLFY